MIKLIKTLLRIRLNQIGRAIQSVGWVLILLLIFCFGAFFLAMIEQLLKAPSYAWTVLIAILLITIHFSRGDFDFLRKLHAHPWRIFITEYFFGLLPLFLWMTLLGRWPDLISSCFIVGLISYCPTSLFRKKTTRYWQLKWLPLQVFEFRGGIRQRWFSILLIGLLSLILSWFFPFTYIIVQLLAAILTSSCFEVIESKDLIESIYLPKKSLWPKIFLNTLVFQGLLLPFHIVFFLRFFTYWYVGLAAIAMSSLILVISIYYKYSGYYPRRLRAYNQTPIGIFFLSMLIPFFWPGALIYLIIKWRQAENKLKHFYARD